MARWLKTCTARSRARGCCVAKLACAHTCKAARHIACRNGSAVCWTNKKSPKGCHMPTATVESTRLPRSTLALCAVGTEAEASTSVLSQRSQTPRLSIQRATAGTAVHVQCTTASKRASTEPRGEPAASLTLDGPQPRRESAFTCCWCNPEPKAPRLRCQKLKQPAGKRETRLDSSGQGLTAGAGWSKEGARHRRPTSRNSSLPHCANTGDIYTALGL